MTKINSLVGSTSLIIVGGDLTSSAQRTEFLAAKHYLDKLQSPYIATIGNHDVWSYDEAIGDRTPFPRGDLLFSEIFHDTFVRARALGRLTYPNVSVPNGRVTNSDSLLHAQSWTFRPGAAFSVGLQNLTFLAPDFNTRDRAPPPCPGSSPVGGCGVTGKADFNNVTGGSWDWFQSELQAMSQEVRSAERSESNESSESKADKTLLKEEQSVVYFVTHQPFRCRFGIPDWYFCYSKIMKKNFRDVVSKYGLKKLFEGGSQLSGHQHRWYAGTAFDEWETFQQFEVSAVKGDVYDSDMSSSFAVFQVDENGKKENVVRWWRENQTWVQGV